MKIRVQAIASFEQVRIGDTAEVEWSERLQGIIDRGYLKVVDDGQVRHRLGSDQGGVGRGGKRRNPNRRKAGFEQSTDPVSGGHDPVEDESQT
jgi:hypothetical protein